MLNIIVPGYDKTNNTAKRLAKTQIGLGVRLV